MKLKKVNINGVDYYVNDENAQEDFIEVDETSSETKKARDKYKQKANDKFNKYLFKIKDEGLKQKMNSAYSQAIESIGKLNDEDDIADAYDDLLDLFDDICDEQDDLDDENEDFDEEENS